MNLYGDRVYISKLKRVTFGFLVEKLWSVDFWDTWSC